MSLFDNITAIQDTIHNRQDLNTMLTQLRAFFPADEVYFDVHLYSEDQNFNTNSGYISISTKDGLDSAGADSIIFAITDSQITCASLLSGGVVTTLETSLGTSPLAIGTTSHAELNAWVDYALNVAALEDTYHSSTVDPEDHAIITGLIAEDCCTHDGPAQVPNNAACVSNTVSP